jgi:molecular chaperone DnaK (HSP70)
MALANECRYSGVSWAYPGRRDVRLITNWPNPKTKNPTNDKVPSTISYENGKVQRWGYSNRPKDETMKWFKILLEPSHKYNDEVKEIKDSSTLLAQLNKSAEEVVADYLRILWDYTMEDIRKEVKEDNWKRDYALKVVITVPAMWSDAAKEKTRRSALMAGMPDNITMITEPEAAALSIIRDKADDEALSVSDSRFRQ